MTTEQRFKKLEQRIEKLENELAALKQSKTRGQTETGIQKKVKAMCFVLVDYEGRTLADLSMHPGAIPFGDVVLRDAQGRIHVEIPPGEEMSSLEMTDALGKESVKLRMRSCGPPMLRMRNAQREVIWTAPSALRKWLR